MAAEWWALGISITALIATLTKEFIFPWIFKPKLTLEGKNDEECPDDALSKKLMHGFEIKTKSRWLRLRLRNKKSFFSKTARNCYVKLIEIRNSKNQRIKPFNAFPLMWVSYAIPKNNLAKGEYHLLDLVFETESERVLFPAFHGSFGFPISLLEKKREKLGPDIYTFKLGVYGDNCEPIFEEFKIELTKKFGELKFID